MSSQNKEQIEKKNYSTAENKFNNVNQKDYEDLLLAYGQLLKVCEQSQNKMNDLIDKIQSLETLIMK